MKVLARSATTLKAAAKHIDYISRAGAVELETDDGQRLSGIDTKALMEDWDLDLDEIRSRPGLVPKERRQPPKLIHKVVFSMPAGTPPDKVLSAVRNFAREQFALKHRYVLALHTDDDHPHVHLVLKAVSEQGVRLNIRNATRRHWRAEFARHLRMLGVPANATERAVRGQTYKAKKDGIYRASLRGESTYLRAQAEALASELLKGGIRVQPGKQRLIETRKAVDGGWRSVARRLAQEGRHELAEEVMRFISGMSPPKTERELLASELLRRARTERVRAPQLTR
ncbi:MAG: relaxase/mobilization nuclease domain-containing protein [Steroidobacteraceae bacterium]